MTITGKEIDMFSSGKGGIYKIENPREPPIVFKNAVTPTPEYSNLVAPFRGLLDYIFYEGVERSSSCSAFTHESITDHIGLPSKVFPSDHLAQIAVLRFRDSL